MSYGSSRNGATNGSQSITMNSLSQSLHVGVFVGAHDENSVVTANFDNFEINTTSEQGSGSSSAPSNPNELAMTCPANGEFNSNITLTNTNGIKSIEVTAQSASGSLGPLTRRFTLDKIAPNISITFLAFSKAVSVGTCSSIFLKFLEV